MKDRTIITYSEYWFPIIGEANCHRLSDLKHYKLTTLMKVRGLSVIDLKSMLGEDCFSYRGFRKEFIPLF